MKKTLAALTALCSAILVGCSTPQQQQSACDMAQTVYTGYLMYASFQAASGEPVDPQQVALANAAAAILSERCGWIKPKSQTGIKSAKGDVVDCNGALVVAPPK